MGKQVIAAIVCVVLALSMPIIALLGSFVANLVSDAQMSAYGSNALVIPILLGVPAAILAFASLIYLKLLYAAVASLALGGLGLLVTASLDGFVWAGLTGGVSILVVSTLLGLGLHSMIIWANKKSPPANLAEEF